MTGHLSTYEQIVERTWRAIWQRDTGRPVPDNLYEGERVRYRTTAVAALEAAGVPALLDVAEAAQRLRDLYGPQHRASSLVSGYWDALDAALKKLPQVEAT